MDNRLGSVTFPLPALSPRARWWLRLAALTCVYVLAGKIGLRFAFLNASASAVWPPTGIALAVILVLGPRVWPAIVAGAFIVNVTTTGAVLTSLGIAVGNTLEGLLGAALVNRYAGGRAVFDRPQTIFAFTALAGLLSTAVSATIGVTCLALAGLAPWGSYGAIWLTWWLGDATGVLVITPPLLLWWTKRDVRWDARQWTEAALLLLALLLAAGGVFAAPILEDYAFLCLPPLVWAAFRFGQREVATAVGLLSLTASWATLRGSGPFVMATQNDSLLVLQAFMATIALMTLPIGALITERRRAETERARLLEQEQAARARAQAAEARFAVLGEIARSITASLDREAVLQRVVDGARALCRSDLAALLLREDPEGLMVPRYRAGPPDDPGGDTLRVEAARRAGERVLVTRRPLRIDEYRLDTHRVGRASASAPARRAPRARRGRRRRCSGARRARPAAGRRHRRAGSVGSRGAGGAEPAPGGHAGERHRHAPGRRLRADHRRARDRAGARRPDAAGDGAHGPRRCRDAQAGAGSG